MKSEKSQLIPCGHSLLQILSSLIIRIAKYLAKLNNTRLTQGLFKWYRPISFRNEFTHPHQFLCICSNNGDTEMKFSPLSSHSGFHSEWNFPSVTNFYSGFIFTKNGLLSAGLKIADAKTTLERTPLVDPFGFIMWMHHNFILEQNSFRNASHHVSYKQLLK